MGACGRVRGEGEWGRGEREGERGKERGREVLLVSRLNL
jgi:hypothetical protein